MARTIATAERRTRLGIRHHLARRATRIDLVAGDLVGLHSSDPATPHIAAQTRVSGMAVADLERALYDDRALTRLHGDGLEGARVVSRAPRSLLFDRNGNAGPTVWCDGGVIGGWSQRPDATIAFRLLEDPGAEARGSIDDAAGDLEAWLHGVRVRPRFPTGLERDLGARRSAVPGVDEVRAAGDHVPRHRLGKGQ